MNIHMQKANMLADKIQAFITFVNKQNKSNYLFNPDRLYHIKLLIEEHKLKILADELKRINQFTWDETYTYYLLNRFKMALAIIDDYVTIYEKDLFMISGRIYTLKNLCSLFEAENEPVIL